MDASMIDTLRLVITWLCTRSCSYCCNNFMHGEFPVRSLDDIDMTRYQYLCLTGGEPLLVPFVLSHIIQRSKRCNPSIKPILYTNADKLTPQVARCLASDGLVGITVGVHDCTKTDQFTRLFHRVEAATDGLGLSVHFNIWEKYRSEAMRAPYYRGSDPVPSRYYHFYKMNECGRKNEEYAALAKWDRG